MNKELLHQIVNALPETPGVYQFHDRKGKIIYIGKAKNLRKRVNSYFTRNRFESFKVKVLVDQIYDVSHIVVNNESDALLLENTLIKKHQPRYNVMLKDDKSFPWICIKNEPFPRVFSTRTVIQDGSDYFGPYTSAYMVKTLLNLIRQLYQLRTCNLVLNKENIEKNKFKLCLEYHIGNCKGPCEGLQSMDEYMETIQQVRMILKGNLGDLLEYLNRQMQRSADEYRFEEANQFKEKIGIISRYRSKSTIVNPVIHDVDVFTIVNDENEAYVNYLKVVDGAVSQAHTVEIRKKLNESDDELLSFAITDLRERMHSKSKEILLPVDLQEAFPENKITVPRRGDKKKLLDLSMRNAKAYRLEKLKRASSGTPLKGGERILSKLRDDLRMKVIPWNIECFDNSNIQGSDPVAACVVFKNGKPARKEYRHYNIKTVKGPDDFASMEEVVYRRYARLKSEKGPLPHLIIIDGGKGQLNAALRSLEKLELKGKISIIGIAKRLEEIYFPGDPVPLYIDKTSASLQLIQHIRNEAHRFGISFHRTKRSGRLIGSRLREIEGIGEKTAEKLLVRFKSAQAVFEAPREVLEKEIGPAKTKRIMEYLNENPGITSSGKL
ncbi:MAG: excinuclease ABC subunit UvrC [Bacteroidales bacterium]|nr:excinuclease ABC subunit UvrC [Bacteroidales bacterium]MBN2699198.1 excinuclease ABC subunit UvrC [Bacteroidales bacterium]